MSSDSRAAPHTLTAAAGLLYDAVMKPGVAAIAALLAVAAAAPASPPTRLAPESTRVLLGVLTDSGASSADLVAAAQALGVAGETAAFPLLSRLWDWPDPEVRKVVAWALSATGDTACVRLLRRLARRDASPAVRAEAVRLLRLWPSHRTV
ncbi:HEAT repeat domain-containing protein, partial [candidate division WOR-3 bacterium]|nr:HEAT repeat domain-containing protein [candidate division WOR-3 bacterium]